MAVNKVEVNGETKLDLTQDTVTPENLLSGATAHNAAGEQISGAVAVAEASKSTPKAPIKYGAVGTGTKYAREDHQHPLQTVKEAEMQWGGGSNSGDVTPIDAAMLPIIGFNKAELSKPAGVTIEYSNDGGVSWVDYGASNSIKTSILSAGLSGSVQIGGGTASEKRTTNDQLRITVNARDCGFYTSLKKILIECSTNGATGAKVLVETAYGKDVTAFTTIGTYPLNGWSGWNSLDVGQFSLGGSVNQTHQRWVMRFTFSITTASETYKSNLQIMHILFLGITNWQTPSNLAQANHAYTYDVNGNVRFPLNVNAKTYSGNATDTTVEFTQRTDRTNIVSGERLTTMTSKIAKWFADLKALAFKDKVDKTDLSDAVQASLGKADSALQSYTETDPTVPAWAKADTKPTYTKSEVGLGNVDNVKQYSANNPPPYPVTSVNGKTGDVKVSVPEVPSTTNLIKGDGAGGLAGAVPETDYASPVIMRKVTLTTAGWNSSTKQQTAAVSGILANGTKQRVICSPVDESYDSAWNACYVQCVGHGADSLTFQCDEIPTAAVEVYVSIQPVSFVS